MSTQFDTQELKLIAQIIDVASQKGLFRAPELMIIGALHKKTVEQIQAAEPTEEKANG